MHAPGWLGVEKFANGLTTASKLPYLSAGKMYCRNNSKGRCASAEL
jgi:hypothetical protein